MEYEDLRKLKERVYFGIMDLADLLKIKPESARVLCSRYVKKGIFIRLKNNFYILEQKWDSLSREDFLILANFLQIPSYVSFMTALWIYEITTQVPRNFFESASLKRSRRFEARGIVFNYYKLKKECYFDFTKWGNIFIASKEKAFIDSVYLYSFGKYKLDFSSLDLDKLDKKRIKKLIGKFPEKTKSAVERICRI